MNELVLKLKKQGVLKTSRIIEAFLAIDRKKFLPRDLVAEAYVDAPLSIGQGQTISQPYTVAFMLELLDPRPKQKILDVGFGSGWTTALLAYIVGSGGEVYGLEIVLEIFERGKGNLLKFKLENVQLVHGSGWDGFPGTAPFDRILVSAASPEIPKALTDQLAIGGKMVIPVGSNLNCSIHLIKKVSENDFIIEEFPGFAFVPLIKK
ncbi:MAG: protein-L-isoaspartate O-methyltransferase [bacterium]|nr:protein-L-isoaspartate O-methyltransferase [bacterium]